MITKEALDLGAWYVILKPFDQNALVKKIRQVKSERGPWKKKRN